MGLSSFLPTGEIVPSRNEKAAELSLCRLFVYNDLDGCMSAVLAESSTLLSRSEGVPFVHGEMNIPGEDERTAEIHYY